jgi:hypothetical protein
MWLVVIDGRSSASVGMSYLELANYMKTLGADDDYDPLTWSAPQNGS